MGLTILAFVAAPLLLLLAAYALGRGGPGAAAAIARRTVVAIDVALAAFSLCQGLAFTLVLGGAGKWPLWFELASGAFLFATHAALLYFVLAFPSPVLTPWRIAGLLATSAIAAFAAYRILATRDFAVMVFVSSLGLARIDGERFRLISGMEAAMGMAAAATLAARSVLSQDRISRQRAAVASAGIALGVIAIWALSGALPSRSGARAAYGLMPLGALAMGAVVTYAYGLSRVFDWRAIGWTVASYAALFVAAGIPAGTVAYLLGLLYPIAPILAIMGSTATFLAAYSGARALSARFLSRTRSRGDYREELESSLSHIDLSLGRESVIAELDSLLRRTLDFHDFSILIEDDRGALRIAHTTSETKLAIERGSALALALESADATVIFKSEALSSPSFAPAMAETLAFFEALKAEVLIVAREGRHAIGAFVFGPRRTGAEYGTYDRDVFKAIYGKLFVFAYYLKNLAKEHLLHTVDRELALSDQVIRFAIENVDKVDRAGVDAAWTMRSTRRLGGDFVDFVRLSGDRWFFVLGDVSGKGLSASMNMLILKSMIRTFLRVERSLTALVARVNAAIKESLPRGTFFAGAFGYFDFAEGSFYYINCGVPTILLYSPGLDTFIEVQGEGRVLGFVRDIAPFIKPRKIAIPPGSVLAAATDGVTDSESLRGERFGKERLKRSIRDRLDHPSRAIADGVVDDLLAFTDRRQEDDITLLVMKIAERSAT
jgi:hypothetical protein